MAVLTTTQVLKIILSGSQRKGNPSLVVLGLFLNLISRNQNLQRESTVKLKKTTTTILKQKQKKLNHPRL
jgi:hypothetical protein